MAISLLLSCEEQNEEPVTCTLEFVYGLHITLIDANTKESITDNITVVIKDGDYEEVLQTIESSTHFFGAGERSGTYTVTVTSDNYKTFVSEPILVTSNECHVKTVSKTFELEPKP